MQKTKHHLVAFALQNTPIIFFVIIFAAFGILSPKFLAYRNFENIVKQASYMGIVAVGMTFVLLTAGIDLSVGSNMYLSVVVAGLLIKNHSAPTWLALVACLATGSALGALNAFAVTKLKMIPFVVTLGTLWVGRGIGLLFTKSVQVTFPDSVTRMGSTRVFGVLPAPILIFGFVVLCAQVFLRRTTIGRQIYAVGNDIETAKKAGINADRVRAIAFIICGLLAALGGFMSIAQVGGSVDAGFGEYKEFDAIAAAVLGGTSLFGGIGSVFPGTVLGVVLIRMISTGLVFTQGDLYLQDLIAAAIIFLAVFLGSVRNIRLTKLARRRIRTESEHHQEV